MNTRRAALPKPNPVQADPSEEALPPLAQRQRETAEYLSDMILELRNLARTAKLHTVMVPLEFAYYEAFGVAHRVEVPSAELERIRTLSRASQDLDLDAAKAGG